MPSLSIAAAFLQLTDLGIPWELPAWQEASGVTHGLFPDNPAHRPKGWTTEDSANIKSLLSHYHALGSEEKKSAFLSDKRGNVLPGCSKWQKWINSIWQSSRSQGKIITVFSARNCHPYTRALAAPNITDDGQEKIVWPSAAQWIPLCLDDIAAELFGDECLEESGFLPERYRSATQALAQRTWVSLIRHLEGALARLPALEKDAHDAFNGQLYSPFPLLNIINTSIGSFIDLNKANVTRTSISTIICAVARWRNVVELFNTSQNLSKVKDMEAELERLMAGLGADIDEEAKNAMMKSKSPPPRKISSSFFFFCLMLHD